MYHSEAVLLADGRILISGSDPQDKVNPQEYRIEVYLPPYLVDGRTQPQITALPVTDWAYGSSHTITVNTFQNGPKKFSLLGAVASTHGMSMGARTIFPQVKPFQPFEPYDIDSLYSSPAIVIRAPSLLRQTHTSARELLPHALQSIKLITSTDHIDHSGPAGTNSSCLMAQRLVTRNGSESVATLPNLASGRISPTSRSQVFRYQSHKTN